MQQFKDRNISQNSFRPCPCCSAPASPRPSAAAAPPYAGRPPRPPKSLGPPRLCGYSGEKANKLYQLRVLTVSKLEVEMCRFYKREQNKSEFPQQFKGEIW